MMAVMLLFTALSHPAFAEKAKDAKTAPAPAVSSPKIIQKTTPPAQMMMDTGKILENLPKLQILSFKKKVEADPGTMMATRPGYTEPTSAAIDLGDEITLSWAIEGCKVQSVTASLSGTGSVSPGTQTTTSEECLHFRGEKSLRPQRTETYTLTVNAQPESNNVTIHPQTKTFQVEVRRPAFTILQPEVNQNELSVAFSVRNSGDGDFRNTPINVSYEVYGFGGRSNFSITTGSFRTSRMTIPRGNRADLGSISLAEFRDQLLYYDAISIRVVVGANYVQPLEEASEMFRHNWTNRTFTLNETMLSILDSISECEVRLNNYQAAGSGWPEVRNDSFIRFAVGGTGSPIPFDLRAQSFTVRVTGKVSGHDYIEERVGMFINAITSFTPASEQLFEIRNGKLGIHLEFPNAGANEIKLGTRNGSNFDDGEVPDINIGAFPVDIWLTPCPSGNKISYNRIEVVVPTISASLTGRFEGLNPLIRDYLSGYVTDEVRRQLNSVLGAASIKRAIEDGIAGALAGVRINHLVSVTGAGDSITVVYR